MQKSLYFYILTMNYIKRIKENNAIDNSIKNNKMVGNTFNQENERSIHQKLYDIDERN